MDETIVYLESNYKKRDISNNLIEYIINSDNHNKIIKNVDYRNNLLMFVDIEDEVESIKIKIITSSKENVKHNG